MATKPSQPVDNQNAAAAGASPPFVVEPTPPEVKNSPPPDGGGFNPPSATPADESPSSDGDGDGDDSRENTDSTGIGDEDPVRTPENGQNSVDPLEGTLTLTLSPDMPGAADPEVTTLIGVFLSSPKNTLNSAIAVEISGITDEDAKKLIETVTESFAAQGVEGQRMLFSTTPSVSPDETIILNMRYITQPGK